MKKIAILLIFFLALVGYSSGQTNEYNLEDLYGAWGDTLQNSPGNGFIFFPDGKWMLIVNGEISSESSEIGKTYYEVDFDTTPMSIDLAAESKKNRVKKSLLGIFEFINEDLIRIEFSFGGVRPERFSDTGNPNQQVLKKAKEN